MNGNLVEHLRAQAALRPDAAALIAGRGADRRLLTFAQLDRATVAGAAMLRGRGLQPGDAVLLLCPVSIALYVALLAVLRAGLVAVFLDPSAGREHIIRCTELLPLRGLVGSRRALLLSLLARPLRRIPVRIGIDALDRGETVQETCTARMSDDPALVTFTSGSTGQPKAVVRSHGFLLSQHRALASSIALAAGEIDLVTLPVFLLANLASGLTSVLPDVDLRAPGAIDAAALAEQLRAEHVGRLAASPALLERLAAHGAACGETFAGLRKVFTGGAPVFPRLLDDLAVVAPNACIAAVYGSTEAEPIAHLDATAITPSDRQTMREGGGLLAGVPEPSLQLRILPPRMGAMPAFTRAEFDAASQPAGSAGEIVVAGDHVLKGYLHGRGDEETKFRVDGEVWHRTGDAGRLDHQGRLWLLGRVSARIERDGATLYPFAVECAVSEIAGVRRSALARVRARVVLAVECAAGANATAVRTAVADAIAWARIDEIRLLGRIPVDRRHNAKVDYPALARALERPAP